MPPIMTDTVYKTVKKRLKDVVMTTSLRIDQIVSIPVASIKTAMLFVDTRSDVVILFSNVKLQVVFSPVKPEVVGEKIYANFRLRKAEKYS